MYRTNSCTGDLGWTLEDYKDEALGGFSEDLDKVGDAIFYARHPELGYRRIRPGETRLANEWLKIRTEVNRLHPCFYDYD